jgi:hypothetical protein
MLPLGIVAQEWPTLTQTAKPAARWWWLGSAVDEENLSYNMEEYAHAGLGELEITPIYGVQGNEQNELSFLSPEWMQALEYTIGKGDEVGIRIDMSTGTGWPFGGPETSIEDAATKAIFEHYTVVGGKLVELSIRVSNKKDEATSTLGKVMAYQGDRCVDVTKRCDKEGMLRWQAPEGEWEIIALFIGKTRQAVKRAAPGGEGYVIDHLSQGAVKRYLDRFEKAFKTNATPVPNNFFNDSYEVYGADWTPDFLNQFARCLSGIHKHSTLGPSADCFNAQLTGSTEQIQYPCTGNFKMKNAEQSFLHPVCRWSGLESIGSLQQNSSGLSGNNSHGCSPSSWV